MKSEKIVKGRRAVWVTWTFLILFFIGIPSWVHADIEDLLSKFHPYITVREEYSNNILLTKTNKLNDFITDVYPGLRFFSLDPGTYMVDLNVIASYVYYEKNHDFSFFSPTGKLNAWYAMTPNLTFRARDYLVRSDAARESISSAGVPQDQQGQFLLSTQRGSHAIYLRNVAEPSIDYRFGSENLFSVLYRNNVYHNQKSDLFESSQENTINPSLKYWFDIHNGVSLDFFHTAGHFQRSPDLVGDGGTARYTYRFDPKLSVFGEYFFVRDNFKNPGTDYDVHNPSLGTQYKFSPTVTGTAQGGYYWQIPDQGTKRKGPFFILDLTKSALRTSYSLQLTGRYTQDYFTAQNLGFTKYYRAYGMINHMLTQRTRVWTIGSVERPMYGDGRKEWIWNVNGGGSYLLFRWLSLSLEGSYRVDRSNVSGFGYKEYRGMFGITMGQPGFVPTTMIGQPTLQQTIY